MKYIDAEKLLAEIERRRLSNRYIDTEGYENELLEIINSLQQEQRETPSGEEVMNMCNQILIDWVKEGKTPEEREQREQAHIRFFELYDEYMQEQPKVDLEKEMGEYFKGWAETDEGIACHYQYVDLNTCRGIARHFYELGINARKEESK